MMMLSFKDFFPPHVGAFISDRSIDFSMQTDQPSWDLEKSQYIAKQLGVVLPEPLPIQQVHEQTVLVVQGDEQSLQKADGLVTNLKQVPLVIRTADCMPIFLYDQKQEAIGLVHAGWRGTRAGILGRAMDVMRETYQTDLSDLKMAFGPAIRHCCYEVGAEFKQYFPDEMLQKEEKYFLDLLQVNRRQAYDKGLKADQIHDCGICTCCHQELFSFRREGTKAGRMISLMVLKSEKESGG